MSIVFEAKAHHASPFMMGTSLNWTMISHHTVAMPSSWDRIYNQHFSYVEGDKESTLEGKGFSYPLHLAFFIFMEVFALHMPLASLQTVLCLAFWCQNEDSSQISCRSNALTPPLDSAVCTENKQRKYRVVVVVQYYSVNGY